MDSFNFNPENDARPPDALIGAHVAPHKAFARMTMASGMQDQTQDQDQDQDQDQNELIEAPSRRSRKRNDFHPYKPKKEPAKQAPQAKVQDPDPDMTDFEYSSGDSEEEEDDEFSDVGGMEEEEQKEKEREGGEEEEEEKMEVEGDPRTVTEEEVREWYESMTSEERVAAVAFVVHLRRPLIEKQFEELLQGELSDKITREDYDAHREQYINIYTIDLIFKLNTFLTQENYDEGSSKLLELLGEQDEDSMETVNGWFSGLYSSRREPNEGVVPGYMRGIEEAELVATEDEAGGGVSGVTNFFLDLYNATLGDWRTKLAVSVVARMAENAAIDAAIFYGGGAIIQGVGVGAAQVGLAGLAGALGIGTSLTLAGAGAIAAGIMAVGQLISIAVRNRDLLFNTWAKVKVKASGYKVGQFVLRQTDEIEANPLGWEMGRIVSEKQSDDTYEFVAPGNAKLAVQSDKLAIVPVMKEGTNIEYFEEGEWKRAKIVRTSAHEDTKVMQYEVSTLQSAGAGWVDWALRKQSKVKSIAVSPDKVRVLKLPTAARLLLAVLEVYGVYTRYRRMLSWSESSVAQTISDTFTSSDTTPPTVSSVDELVERGKAAEALKAAFAKGYEDFEPTPIQDQILDELQSRGYEIGAGDKDLVEFWRGEDGVAYIEEIGKAAEYQAKKVMIYESVTQAQELLKAILKAFGHTIDIMKSALEQARSAVTNAYANAGLLSQSDDLPVIMWSIANTASEAFSELLRDLNWKVQVAKQTMSEVGRRLMNLGGIRKKLLGGFISMMKGLVTFGSQVLIFGIRNIFPLFVYFVGTLAISAVSLFTMKVHSALFNPDAPLTALDYKKIWMDGANGNLYKITSISWDTLRELGPLPGKSVLEKLITQSGSASFYTVMNILMNTAWSGIVTGGEVIYKGGKSLFLWQKNEITYEIAKDFFEWCIVSVIGIVDFITSDLGSLELNSMQTIWKALTMFATFTTPAAIWFKTRHKINTIGRRTNDPLTSQKNFKETVRLFRQGNEEVVKELKELRQYVAEDRKVEQQQDWQEKYKSFKEAYNEGKDADDRVNNGLVWLRGTHASTLFTHWIEDSEIKFTKEAPQGEDQYLSSDFWNEKLRERQQTLASGETIDYGAILSQNSKIALDNFINVNILGKQTKKRSEEDNKKLKDLYNKYVENPDNDFDKSKIEELEREDKLHTNVLTTALKLKWIIKQHRIDAQKRQGTASRIVMVPE